MTRPRRPIPLAWRNLTESPWRFAASVAGTTFAVVLMFSQVGFRNALLENMAAVITRLDGDLFVTQRERYVLSTPAAFPRRRLDLIRSVPGVAQTHPFYVEIRPQARWRNPTDGTTRPIRVLAFRPADELLEIPELIANRDAWSAPDTAMADLRSKRSVYGRLEPGQTSELAGRRIRVAGTFSLGTDFRSNGTVVLSEENLLRYLPWRRAGASGDTPVDVGVVRLEPSADRDAVQQALAKAVTPDLVVLSKPQFVAKEQRFWENVAPLGVVFDIGLIMGFVVGLGICYQVLYAEISDRMAEFATLKAMGYSNSSLLRTIVLEGVYLAIVGYAAGLLVSFLLFKWLQSLTGLSMILTPSSLLVILSLTLVMCITAGLLAGRRLATVDPAELFS